MFSKLRPGHAKRNTASSLAPPEPVVSPAACPLPSPSHTPEYLSSPRLHDNASYTSGSPISPFPPQLPPITRVASKLDKAVSPNSSQSTPSQYSASTGGSSSRIGQDRGMLSPPQFLPPKPEHALLSEMASQSSTHLAPAVSSAAYSSFSRSQTSLLSGISEKLSGSSKATLTPTAAPTKTKSRLNLRNPMSLLMRRRSGQTLDPLSDDALVTQHSPANVPPMPDNYDPSIRGNIVHDFNAPRLNRNFSYNNAYGSDDTQQDLGRVSPPRIDKEHTPVFRENFDDDTSYEESQAAIRAEQLVNTDFLARNLVQPPPLEYSPPPPPLPKISPPLLENSPPPPQSFPPPWPSYHGFDGASSVLSPVHESENPLDVSADVTPRKRKSTKTPPPPARSRATSVTDPSFQPAGLPAHFSSSASRFSFQITSGTDSAQEKELEERHKVKAAEKASKEVPVSNTIDDEYDEYGMDDYDDMNGGYDEEIPMLGEEDDFRGLGDQTLDSGMKAFDFSSLSIQPGAHDALSPMNPLGQLQTSVDMNGNPIGFAMSEEMLQRYQLSAPPIKSPDTSAKADPIENNQRSLSSVNLDDDMYFDDGLIGDQDEIDATGFDENVFDDPSGPLYERKVKFSDVEDGPAAPPSRPYDVLSSETGYEADDDTVSKHLEKTEPLLAHKTSVAQQLPVPTFDNLSAYHSALADAATRAEAAGRFGRQPSIDAGHCSSDIDDLSSLSNSRPSLVPDDGRLSLDTIGFPPDDDVYGMSSSFVDDYDYSDFDSAMEDDPIIAAANAEALAYDDEGFYGQEFGFYPSAVGESPSTWGGFFGPSGVGRTVSGRNAVREPNLTPITERSEYSTRNSFISLNHFRDGQQPVFSPGSAQLARMSPYGFPTEDEDMSLETLRKLRKGAFGSSLVSLPGSASNSPRNSSPMGMQFVPRTSSPAGSRMKEHNDSSLESLYSSADITDDVEGNEEDGDESLMDAVNGAYEDDFSSEESDKEGGDPPESPTLTASDYNSLSSPSHFSSNEAPPLPSILELYAQHNIVTYVREHDEAGEGRWVLERRRTAESGELELIGRAIVEGGRI
ncbi:hypothetical protein EJ02DRAFT_377960 [Clathrospora elynae]|uniref:Uncharacterized protein n=1 Tax=Clathrospora elynae TaxID=706981 RepID=A0A6A5SL01_9PLEO|nr:hypothetical protein EJ02DRAFT_377960 [Clathrospora elynae]